MITSAIKKADICVLFYFTYGISNLESWNHEKKKGRQFYC